MGTSSSRRPRIDTRGLVNLTNEHKLNWERLIKPGRAIQETKFTDPINLRELGLRAPVQLLMGNVGLQGFLDYEARTYERYTLEFPSTLTKGGDEEGPFITFHLNDEELKMYYSEVMEAFGWDYVTDEEHYMATLRMDWFAMQGAKIAPSLIQPSIHSWVACYDPFLSRKEKGKISMGGMVTLLANYLDIGVPLDDEGNSLLKPLGTVENTYLHTRPSNVYNFKKLKRASMLWIAPQGAHYVWLYGANSVKYMSLPQHNQTNITTKTSMDQLYLTLDEQYQYQMDGFEDNMYSMSSMVSTMNQFYVSHYPDYHDPSAEIELRRQQRQAEHANRRGHQEPGGPFGS
ncbi:3-(3-hydroxy-phenyl)propionate/3-hydroxycinnamic acid hydroxylase [Bienertia sinuspersici]